MINTLPFYEIIGFVEPACEASETLCNVPDLSNAALFLDFDGTLVDLAERPDAIVVPAEVGDLLAGLRTCTDGALAIVSGRRLDEVAERLPDYDGIIVGSHGGEYRIDGGVVDNLGPETEDPAFLSARDMLRAWVERHEGVLLEEKPVSLVLHYRQAPKFETDCTDIIMALAQTTNGFEMRPSKMAVELMPSHISKESAVRTLMERWPGRVPIAIGDDHTDEGMFTAADALGGYGLKVGEGRTMAHYRVRDVETLRMVLRFWLENPTGASCQVG